MKKLFLILIPILFIGCSKTVYVDRATGSQVIVNNSMASAYFNYDVIYEEIGFSKEYYIYRDKNTDVLYYSYVCGYKGFMTPIMKADGSCLTYTEWKEKTGK